jgi:hypothetical protein
VPDEHAAERLARRAFPARRRRECLVEGRAQPLDLLGSKMRSRTK